MRPSSFQRIDIALSRDLQTDYDKIKVIADNIDAIESISNAIDNGVDFGDIAALATTVSEHTAELDTKVDKEVGKSLMTDAEHTKLQFIQQQATKNQADVYLLDRVNHTGTQDLDTTTDGVDRFAMTAAERAKLATVEDRANHTGTQSIDTITDSLSRMAMTNEEKTKLAGIEDSANNYVHPNKHSVTVLDGTGQFSKVVKTDGAGVVGFGDVSWAEVGGKPTTFVPTAHEHSLDDVTSGTIAAARIVMSEGRQFINAEQATAILDMEVKSNKGIPLGYAPLDANGKLNPSYLNDLNLIEVFTPADLNSMLNLNSAQPGDIAYRLDTEATYMLVALPVNTVGNWKQLNAGMSVVSVNGLTGVVNLNTANIAEGGSNYYFTNERVDDRVAALIQAGTNVSVAYDDVSNTLTISANGTSVNWSEIQSKPTTVAGYAISDVSTTSQIDAALALKANVESPVFTGNVTGLGIATGTSFNAITGLASVAPLIDGNAAVGTSTLAARQDHVHPAQITITGNAATATKLAATKTISGVAFDGSDNINIEDRLGTPIAAAATTTVGTAGLGDYIRITGNTGITSFGTAATAGIRRTLIFDEALTLTHNATSLICVGGVSIVTVAGMVIEVVAETTANWRVVSITHPSISVTELGYLDGVTSALQTQIDTKQTAAQVTAAITAQKASSTVYGVAKISVSGSTLTITTI